jgi:DNA-binding PadR family transcriptional regulator
MGVPLSRLKRKIEKENLWVFILSSLRSGKMCGKELKERVEKRFDFLTGKVTAYKVLYLLESGGYVKSAKSGKRVYYQITGKGKKELDSGRSYLKRLSKAI